MTEDIVSEAIPCTFCGHRYLRPCATQERADQCGNYQFMTSAGSVGRINHPIITPADALLRQLEELKKLAQ